MGGNEAYKEDKDKGCAPQAEWYLSRAASLWPRVAARKADFHFA